MLWDVIVNEAEDAVKNSIEDWVRDKVSNVTVYGSKWAEMLDKDIMGIRREQAFLADRLPYIITKIDGVSSGYIGFGRNLVNRSYTDVRFEGTEFDLSDGQKEFKFVASGGVKYKFVTVPWIFENPAYVTVDDLLGVMRDQLGGRVVLWKGTDDYLNMRVWGCSYIEIVRDDIFGGLSGRIDGVYKKNESVILKGALSITIGCQAPRTRSEMKDLILLWIDNVRKFDGGLIGKSEKVRVVVNSIERGVGDSDIPFGGGDVLKLLYMSGVGMDVLIEAEDTDLYVEKFDGIKKDLAVSMNG